MVRWVPFLLLSMMVLTILVGRFPAPAQSQQVCGDANGDGKVSLVDATLALQFAVGSRKPTEAQIPSLDLNGDGKIQVGEVIQILRKAINPQLLLEGRNCGTVSTPTGITVTSPNGGETWQAGTTQTIRWTYTGNPGSSVKIELYKGGVLNRVIVLSTPIESGSYPWTIPSTQPPGRDYTVKVTSTTESTYSDTSDNPFTISGIPGLFIVNTVEDTGDAVPGDGQCQDTQGNCSLRAAIMEANAFKASAPVVIDLPAGTYRLTRTSLDIGSNLILRGAGPDRTLVDGGGSFRVFEVYEGMTVTLEDIRVQNGRSDLGGGILNSGTLTLKNSTVSGNTAHPSQDGSGGGIYNRGTLTLKNSTVSENSVAWGGGIANDGILTLENSTVSGNSAEYDGGGIDNTGILTLKNSTVSGNSARYGGGISHSGGLSAVLILLFTTITGNRAKEGGGLFTDSRIQLKGVILAGNQSDSGAGVTCPPGGAILLLSLGYNLIQNITLCNFTPDPTDVLGPDPLLGPLADNGGPTPTHLPQSGSPVRDRVPASACTDLKGNPISTDQRGVSRPQGSACDIGAVEQ